MKLFNLLIAGALLFGVTSCEKDCDEPATPTPKTRTEMLTGKTWMYDEYFTNYNTTNTQLSYKRGKPNNAINLSQNRATYYANGTYTEINQNGQTLNGTWSFQNNETQFRIVNSVGTFTANIIAITDSTFIWLDPTASGGTMGKWIPQ